MGEPQTGEPQTGEPQTEHEEYDPVTADQVARQPQEGQVLGRSVPTPEKVTRAEPGSPETGARRDESGKPVS
jgi:hypothetical protein